MYCKFHTETVVVFTVDKQRLKKDQTESKLHLPPAEMLANKSEKWKWQNRFSALKMRVIQGQHVQFKNDRHNESSDY